MKKLSLSENKEIFELKNKCRVVQNKISKVVQEIPVRNNIKNIESNSKDESINNLELTKKDETTANM